MPILEDHNLHLGSSKYLNESCPERNLKASLIIGFHGKKFFQNTKGIPFIRIAFIMTRCDQAGI